MPRGVQKSIDDRLLEIGEQISEMEVRKEKIQEKIKELKQKKETVLSDQRQKRLEELNDALTQSGKTPEEILQILKAGDPD